MSMQDPIADMLTRVRNGQMAMHDTVNVPASKIKEDIAKVLADEGYISAYRIDGEGSQKTLIIKLKYYQDKAVIDRIARISKTGLRVYRTSKELGEVAGFGIAIVSTSQGVMSHLKAKSLGVGGEVLCEVA